MSVDKSSVLKKLRESDAIYVLMSDCTRMPFVVCDPETYDDEVFIFFSEEDAMRGGQEFLKANNPLKIFNIEKKYLLPFYSSLFPIGVNCMVIGKGTEEEIAIQLGNTLYKIQVTVSKEQQEQSNMELIDPNGDYVLRLRFEKELLVAVYQNGVKVEHPTFQCELLEGADFASFVIILSASPALSNIGKTIRIKVSVPESQLEVVQDITVKGVI